MSPEILVEPAADALREYARSLRAAPTDAVGADRPRLPHPIVEHS